MQIIGNRKLRIRERNQGTNGSIEGKEDDELDRNEAFLITNQRSFHASFSKRSKLYLQTIFFSEFHRSMMHIRNSAYFEDDREDSQT